MSTSSRMVCEQVAGIFERHVAGTATAAEAAALASHALTCERCASAIGRVEEYERRFGPPPAPPSRPAVTPWRAGHPLIIAAAALTVLALAAVSMWHTATRPAVVQPVLRGRGGTLGLLAMWQPDGTLRLAWPPTPKAGVYHLRLSGTSGVELLKSVTQPLVTLQASEVAALGDVVVVVDSEAGSGERTSRSTLLRLGKGPAQ